MKKIKLNDINLPNLKDNELSTIKGGQTTSRLCACACKYANSGGSSTNANGNANQANKLCSPGMKSMDQIMLEQLDMLLNTTITPNK